MPIGYHAMRMRWCRAALWAFLRRWAVYLVGAAVLFGAGMYGGPGASVTAVRSLCAWWVLPLFQAAADPVWFVFAVGVHALVGAGVVWGMRPLLWPARWALAERALPIARRVALLSDCRVVPLGLLPWMLPCAIGAHALLARDPAWLQPVRGRALSGLCFALAGSVGLGVASLQWLRRPPRTGRGPEASVMPAAGSKPTHVRVGWRRALLWWPLWRGPARRSGRLLVSGSVALCLPALGLLRWPAATGWWLAAYALGSLIVVTRLNGLAHLELQMLMQACSPLPLAPRALQRGREALALAPLPITALPLIASLTRAEPRPWVLAGYVVAVAASCAFEVQTAPADAAGKVSRWLFCVALMLALGSEVVA